MHLTKLSGSYEGGRGQSRDNHMPVDAMIRYEGWTPA